LRRASLQIQLTVRLGLLFLVATALAVAALALEGYRTASSLGEQNLMQSARELARSIRRDGEGVPVLALPSALSALYGSPTHVALYAIRDAGGEVIAASDAELRHYAAARGVGGKEPRFFRLDSFYSGRDYYGVDVALPSAAGPVFVTVAEAGDADDLLHAILEEFFLDAAWILPVFVAATLLVGVLAIRAGLRPLRAASAEAALIGPGTPSLRLTERTLPGEIRPLAQAVNRALDRLERGLAVQRRFTADAAHELRTPLAIITGALEAVDGHAEIDKLKQDVARMNRLVDQLLRVARLDSLDVDVSADVDLSDVAREVVEYMAPLAIAQARSIALVGASGPVVIKGNRHAVADALRNLVENAIHHTPPGTEVGVAVGGDGTLSVGDRGPGVPSDARDRIFDRFWRGANVETPGAGLGLAIVRETMRAHGGDVAVSTGPHGGATFTLRFRAQRDGPSAA
jgi:signal transduction histidine kinase